LDRAGVLFGTPIERLRHMNLPAYEFYLHRNPCVDLASEMLEIDVCAQHNNGGLVVDTWWQSNVAGFFPVGEAGGSHGVYRPGGAALNSGQVGATRAAQFIAARRDAMPVDVAEYMEAAAPVLAGALGLVEKASSHAAAGVPDNTGDLLRDVGELMSAKAGPVRSERSINEALAQVHDWLARYEELVSADVGSRRAVDRIFLIRDILTTAYVYLSAMADFTVHGGRSRGSVLNTDPAGSLPVTGHGPDATVELDLPESFRFRLDGGALDGEIQEAAWLPAPRDDDDLAGRTELTWRPVRPIPDDDDFFENVWRQFREHRNIY
ncbi:MAG TPA: FAD-binding protein, partial [Coriobacteriia bacterium]|nr:FAD-binding protein [Coriobacteriia bacterium]